MKIGKLILLLVSIAIIAVVITKEISKPALVSAKEVKIKQLAGHYDNYRQFWGEQTVEFGKEKVQDHHEHYQIHVDSIAGNSKAMKMKIFKGRNSKMVADSMLLEIRKNKIGNHELLATGREVSTIIKTKTGFRTEDGFLRVSRDTLFIDQLSNAKKANPYLFLKKRNFTGWVRQSSIDENTISHNYKDLEIHDQGGRTQVNINGKAHTFELAHMVNADKKEVMKLTIYASSKDSITVNSKIIAQSITNPKSKIIGTTTGALTTEWKVKK